MPEAPVRSREELARLSRRLLLVSGGVLVLSVVLLFAGRVWFGGPRTLTDGISVGGLVIVVALVTVGLVLRRASHRASRPPAAVAEIPVPAPAVEGAAPAPAVPVPPVVPADQAEGRGWMKASDLARGDQRT